MPYRMPNGYGSVIKLSGRRRKPYAVRVTTSYELIDRDGTPNLVQKYKYLEYFEKRKDAALYLANYNAGMCVREHENLQDAPTLAAVYDRWIEERENSRKGLSRQLANSYGAAFKKYQSLHKRRIRSLRLSDVQPILDANSDMSRGTVSNMMTVIRGIYHYAMRYELVDNDFTGLLIGDGQASKQIHTAFTDEEIRTLWSHAGELYADFALITIYSGMRPTEALNMQCINIDIDKRIMIGGVKTAAGRDRSIPIHKKILPLIRARMAGETLFPPCGDTTFRDHYKDYMEKLSMPHLPHDGRHTCATLMERSGVPLLRRKLILGHKVRDITEGIYTHVDVTELVAEIDKITV